MSANSIGGKLKLAAAGLALFASLGAQAQSSVAGLAGSASPGDVAIVQNMDTGFTREVKVKDNGKYQLRNLPTGTFSVIIKHPDGSMETARVVTLQVGSTARVP